MSVPSTPEDMILGKSYNLEPLLEETGLHCLKDPSSSHTLNPSSKISKSGEEIGNPSGRQSLLSGVMESARHRFDSFWTNQKNAST